MPHACDAGDNPCHFMAILHCVSNCLYVSAILVLIATYFLCCQADLVCAVLIIKFIDLNYGLEDGNPLRFGNIPVVAIGIMILPLYDTVRVFITRIIRGHSPFHPDRRHIHHLLIDFGMSHMRATATLVFVNLLFICFVLSTHRLLGLHTMLAIVLALATALTYILHRAVVRKNLDLLRR